ncbi:MAG: hypothetical protein E7438_03480 [Ruminococcaceae bacterium]|nr:hypothetical protein [Oscillospiraceae bacterium]
MKRFLSMLMAVTMIAAVMLAFPAPAKAVSYPEYIHSPYCEYYFTPNIAPGECEFQFVVAHEGNYYIQTFGTYDAEGLLVNNSVSMTLYDSNNDFVIDCYDGRGYAAGAFISVYLNAGETYTLHIYVEEDTYFGRLSFSNAVSPRPDGREIYGYEDLNLIEDYVSNMSVWIEFDIDSSGSERAVAHLLRYNPGYFINPHQEYIVSVDGCSCSRVYIIEPFGHEVTSMEGEVRVHRLHSGMRIVLNRDVLYYVVAYYESGNSICEDHEAFNFGINVTLEKIN